MTEPAPERRLRPHAAPFAERSAAGELRVQRCSACGTVPEFPRIACPACFAELEWIDAAGRGCVFTFGVVRRPHDARFQPELPIVLAVVELDEGPFLISAIVGDDRLETAIGSAVAVAGAGGFTTLPQFRLVGDRRG
jgi:uncharacterized OB-fold protein